MSSQLPCNEEVEAFSRAVPWQQIEQQKRRFNERLKILRKTASDDDLPLDDLSKAAGVPLGLIYDDNDQGNVIVAEHDDHQYIIGSFVSKRYRFDEPLLKCIIPYNFNPAVNHTNIDETDNPDVRLRALGAELELGLYRPDGSSPDEEEMNRFIKEYERRAHTLGITPTVDREACEYQVEVHIAPGTGFSPYTAISGWHHAGAGRQQPDYRVTYSDYVCIPDLERFFA